MLRGRATRGHRGATPSTPHPAPAQPRPAATGNRKSCAESRGGPDPRAGRVAGGGKDTTHAGQVCVCVCARPILGPVPRWGVLHGAARLRRALRAGAAAPRERAQVRGTVRLRAGRGGGVGGRVLQRGASGADPTRVTPSGVSGAGGGGAGPCRARRPGLLKAQQLTELPRGRGAERRCGRRQRRHHRSRMTKHGGAVRGVPQHRARAARSPPPHPPRPLLIKPLISRRH